MRVTEFQKRSKLLKELQQNNKRRIRRIRGWSGRKGRAINISEIGGGEAVR